MAPEQETDLESESQAPLGHLRSPASWLNGDCRGTYTYKFFVYPCVRPRRRTPELVSVAAESVDCFSCLSSVANSDSYVH